MFTGLIEEIGLIHSITRIPNGMRIGIRAHKIFDDLKIDDSVSINGACQTVIHIEQPVFYVEAVGETLEKTTFKNFKIHQEVNLERALTLQTRLGGHLVQGHVNGVGMVKKLERKGENWDLLVQISDHLIKYCVDEGSIAIDGISLTIAEKINNQIRCSIIPHTYSYTTIRNYKVGSLVNVEVDIIAKYLESLLKGSRKTSGLSIEDLKNWGY